MKRIIIQGIVIIVLFFTTWFALTQVDWMTIFHVQKVTDNTEEKLGNLFWGIFKKTEKENNNPLVINPIDSIVNKICLKNAINRDFIKVHIVIKDDINAFALPDGHLIIYSGLILAADNQEELSGVICHEIAHIELNHVMKKLIKEVGLSVLISMTAGNKEIINKTAKMLSSSAFDRNLEKEADIKAVDYLINAKIDPVPFANFLYKLSDGDHEAKEYSSWISTHPDSKKRAEYIIEYSKGKSKDHETILSNKTWDNLKEKLKE